MAQRKSTNLNQGKCQQLYQKHFVQPSAHESAGNPLPSSQDFVKVEKNLSSLGFFTPSNKKIQGTKEKIIRFTRQIDGKAVEVRATILPSAAYGLPITGDQDKYLALQKIICDIRREKGEVKNPLGFTSAELLRILGLRVTAGKNYDDIVEWARRMTLTGICSEGVIYFAGRKMWASDTFHVFERFVSLGNPMPDGSIADKNYVWLSEWQLENINHNHLLPVDLEAYKQLKNHIAKALVPLLQIWLYATREWGYFEKRYEDLCQILNVSQYQHLSKIKEKLGPSLDELQKHHYIDGWKIQETNGSPGFKIIFYHGNKFRRDHTNRMAQREQIPIPHKPPLEPEPQDPVPGERIDNEHFSQSLRRGISEKASIELLRNLRPDQQVMDQLEWGDYLLTHAPSGKFYNPAGLYIHLIKENVIPSERFETSRQRKLREAARQARELEEQELARLELAYMDYKKEAVDRFIRQTYTAEQFAACIQAKKQELLRQDRWKRYLSLNKGTQEAAVERQVRAEIANRIRFMTFAEYREKQGDKKDENMQSIFDGSDAGELLHNSSRSSEESCVAE